MTHRTLRFVSRLQPFTAGPPGSCLPGKLVRLPPWFNLEQNTHNQLSPELLGKPGSQERGEVERDLQELAHILRNFNDRIPAVEKLEERVMSSDDRRTIYVVNTIAYCAEITLYDVWAEEGDQTAADIGIHAARQVARVPKAGVELGLLDPVLGVRQIFRATFYIANYYHPYFRLVG